MLTIRFDALGLQPGDAVLDVGSGFGRHVYECARRGARVVALDHAAHEVIETRNT
jgi:cyclopropane fatty-acyl-phospholipid synthase-like methyltransferase